LKKEKDMEINFEKLRDDLKNDSYGAFYGGGIGPALLEAFQAERASESELIAMAERRGFNLDKYIENR